MQSILNVAGLSKRFGGIRALQDVNLQVRAGTIHSIIGPNGAGKTSLFNCITRVYDPDQGDVTSNGVDLLGVKPHRVPYLGIARTFQNLQLFPHMSVLENVLTGSDFLDRVSIIEHLFKLGRARRSGARSREIARESINRFGLSAHDAIAVAELPYGVQKMVELARALAMQPKLLLLDEPTAGLNSDEILKLKTLLRTIHEEVGVTMLVIAHDVGFVMQLSDHITVLDFGKVIADGPPADIVRNIAVQEAYLGKDLEHA